MPVRLIPVAIAWALSISASAWAAWDYRGALADQEQLAAVESAIEKTRTQQKEINDATQKQLDETRAINDSLSRDIIRLRKRPSRSEPPARVDCPRTTGATLLREDAGFLRREAARADRLRAALKACYDYADAIH